MVASGQDPLIDEHIEKYMKEVGFEVVQHEQKHVDLSKIILCPRSIQKKEKLI